MSDIPYFRDKVLKCHDCNEEFVWAWQDQRDWHKKQKDLTKTRPEVKLSEPQICPICRRRRRKEDERIKEVRKKQEERMKEEIQKENVSVSAGKTIESKNGSESTYPLS